MKKLLSLLLSSAMLISALPVRAADSASTDQYFTETRTVDYSQPRYQNEKVAFGTDTAAYSFKTVSGDTLSLLDVNKNSTTSRYFMITSKGYAQLGIDMNNNDKLFDSVPANGETSDAAAKLYPSWSLNNEFFEKSWWYNKYDDVTVRLASDVRDCIDMTHVWNVEPTPNGYVSNEAYSYTAGIAYPSISEILAYADRFAVKTTADHDKNILTRTFVNNESLKEKGRYVGVVSLSEEAGTGVIVGGWNSLRAPVRPCFWTNDQFFAKVAVDLSTAGAAVLQEIKKVKPITLAALYNANDLKTYLGIDVDSIDYYFTDTRTVNYAEASNPYNAGYSGKYSTSASDYTFETKEGDSFSLLDVKDSTSAKYFMITSKQYARAQAFRENGVAEYFKMPEDSLKFESNSVKNYQYPSWGLNGNMFIEKSTYDQFNEFNGNTVRISDKVREYIDWNHTWKVEAAPNAKKDGVALPNDVYTYTAGIVYPSMGEIVTYADRFLTQTGGNIITTRTFINNPEINDRRVAVVNSDKTDKWSIGGWNLSTAMYFPVRPVFWLNDQFFANVKVDLSTAGAAVKQEIKKVSLYKLLEIYTADELRNQLGLTIPNEIIELYNVEVRTRSGNDPAYGETLIPYYNVFSDAGFDIKDVEVTWKKTDGTTETTIGTSKEYIVTEADAADGKTKIYFDLKVTGATGTTVERTSYKTTIDSLGVAPIWPNDRINGVKYHAEAANKFKVGDKNFILLDSFDNDESTFLVTVADDYGSKSIDDMYMDPTDPTNYAYWLDNTFKTSGNGDGKVLPTQIVKYINNNHIWLTEGAPLSPKAKTNDKINAQNYTFKAGVTAISASELKRYKDKIGSTDGFDSLDKVTFSTRSISNYTNENNTSVSYNLTAQRGTPTDDDSDWTSENLWFPPWPEASGTHVKPVFYLTKEFFKNVEFDFDDLGANVKKAMQEIYSVEELAGLYDEEYLGSIGFENKTQLSVSYSKYGDAADLYETLNGATSLQANVTYTAAKAGINAKAILALYDGNGKLVEVAVKPLISTGKTASATVGFEELSDIGLGHYTKLMLWDDMKPITKADIFSSDNGLNLAENVSVLTSTSEGNNFF